MPNPPPMPSDAKDKGEGVLDAQRAASMADEGGSTAAHREQQGAQRSGAKGDDDAGKRPEAGPMRLWALLALGLAKAIAKLTARARRVAARRVHARTHGE